MSREAPWLALSVDWHHSEMLDDAPAGQKLSWVAILCFSKSHGRGGRCKLRRRALCRDFGIDRADLDALVMRAADHGAIEIDQEDNVTIVNWASYQDPKKRATRGSTIGGDLVKDKQFTKSTTTHHPSPITKHQSPSTKDQNSDQFRAAAFAALERAVGQKITASNEYQLDRAVDLLPDPLTIHGESRSAWELTSRALSEAAIHADCKTVGQAIKYMRTICERCIRDECWPGEFDDVKVNGKPQGETMTNEYIMQRFERDPSQWHKYGIPQDEQDAELERRKRDGDE